MKKILFSFCAFFIALSSCGNDDEILNEEKEITPATTEIKYIFDFSFTKESDTRSTGYDWQNGDVVYLLLDGTDDAYIRSEYCEGNWYNSLNKFKGKENYSVDLKEVYDKSSYLQAVFVKSGQSPSLEGDDAYFDKSCDRLISDKTQYSVIKVGEYTYSVSVHASLKSDGIKIDINGIEEDDSEPWKLYWTNYDFYYRHYYNETSWRKCSSYRTYIDDKYTADEAYTVKGTPFSYEDTGKSGVYFMLSAETYSSDPDDNLGRIILAKGKYAYLRNFGNKDYTTYDRKCITIEGPAGEHASKWAKGLYFPDRKVFAAAVSAYDANNDGMVDEDEVLVEGKSIYLIQPVFFDGLEHLTKLSDLTIESMTRDNLILPASTSIENLSLKRIQSNNSFKACEIDISGLSNLESLRVGNFNQDINLVIANPNNIQSLCISTAPNYSSFDFTKTPELQSIELTNTGYETLDLSSFENLSYISIQRNEKLTTIYMCKPGDLNLTFSYNSSLTTIVLPDGYTKDDYPEFPEGVTICNASGMQD